MREVAYFSLSDKLGEVLSVETTREFLFIYVKPGTSPYLIQERG